MIPGTIDASAKDEDSDSVLSDEDEAAALMIAAIHFGGGLRSESNNPTAFNAGDPGDGCRTHQQRYYDTNQLGSNKIERAGRRRVEIDSQHESTNSSCNSDRIIRRNNTKSDPPTASTRYSLSNLSIQVPPGERTESDDGEGKCESPVSLFNGMSQIAEDCNEDNTSSGCTRNIPKSQGSGCSNSATLAGIKSSISTTNYYDESEQLNIAMFNDDFPREVQRLSASMPALSSTDPTGTLRSSLRMSGKKRRSHADTRTLREEIDDAAAVVAKMYAEGNFSDSDDDGSIANRDLLSSSRGNSRRSSARSQISSPGLTNVDSPEGRPRKRLSSNSRTQRRSFGMTSNDDLLNAGFRSPMNAYFKPHPGSSTSAMAAAQAVVLADEANTKYAACLNLNQDPQVDNNNNAKQRRRRAQRRPAFIVPTFQREAARLQADRMVLLEKDRIESRLARRGARRSLSYTTGSKMNSNIIGTSLPEDSETAYDDGAKAALEVQEHPDFQKLKMNRLQRRVNSMPDPNAVQRLSQSAVNTNVDFSVGPDIDAAAAGPSHSLPSIWQPTHGITSHLFNNMGPPRPIQHGFPRLPPQMFGPLVDTPFCTMTTGTSISSNLSMPSSSLGSSNQFSLTQPTIEQLQNNIELESIAAIQNLIARTAEASQVLAHQLVQSNSIISNLRGSNRSHFDDDLFDGKQMTVFAREIPSNSPTIYNTAILLHEACKKDDTAVVENVLQNFPLSTRHSLQGSDNTGDVTLHVAAQHGSNAAARLILDFDMNCALIRNGLGYAPVHYTVEYGHLATAITLITMVPECARIQCESGFLPLHDCVTTGAEQMDAPQIMTALLHAFTDAVFVTNDEGLLPVHLAALSGFEIGLRTLLASEFSTIYSRDKLEDMLPLDIAVQKLAEIMSEEPSDPDDDVVDDATADIERNPKKAKYIACIEILLSSMLYDRLVLSPREFRNGDKPFLPLHSAIGARPHLETWNTLFEVYGDEHIDDIDLLGRNVAHKICSRPIENIDTDLTILNNLDRYLFTQSDNYGFVPLHLALQNRDAPIQFITKIARRHRSSLSRAVTPVVGNIYANLSPVHIAAASGCDLTIIFFLMKSHPDTACR